VRGKWHACPTADGLSLFRPRWVTSRLFSEVFLLASAMSTRSICKATAAPAVETGKHLPSLRSPWISA